MSYVVLARKYRPQTFAALIGQEAIVRTLKNAMAMDRVHHAFVLTGARGVGKTSTARLLARGLNCVHGPTTEPCQDCASCQAMLQGTSQNILEIDGASNTGVDSVRDLRETAKYRPQNGPYKIYIIDEVHMLSQAAFNALLKTLEEPPAHVKFIFATTEPHKIPATILSRCQRFDLRRVSVDMLAEHMRGIVEKEQLQIGTAALLTIAREAQGSVRDALSLLDQALSYAGGAPVDDVVLAALGAIDRQLIFDLVEHILARRADALLDAVALIESKGYDWGDVARLLLAHLRDVALAGCLRDASKALPDRSQDELAALQAQAHKRGQEDWQRLFEKACQVAESLARSSVPKMTFEMGLLRLTQIAPAADLQRLLRQIDDWMAHAPGAVPASGTGGSGGGDNGGTDAGKSSPGASSPFRPAKTGASAAPASAHSPKQAPDAREPQAQAVQSQTTAPQPTGAPQAAAKPAPLQTVAPAQVSPSALVQTPQLSDSTELVQAPEEVHEKAPGQAAAQSHSDAPADVHAAWHSFVASVRAARPSLASVLEHGQVVTFLPSEAVVAFPGQSFWWDSVTDQENRTLFEQVLRAQFHEKSTWRVVPLEGQAVATPSLASQRVAREAAAWQATQEIAQSHAGVRAALQILGGTVQEIRRPQDAGIGVEAKP